MFANLADADAGLCLLVAVLHGELAEPSAVEEQVLMYTEVLALCTGVTSTVAEVSLLAGQPDEGVCRLLAEAALLAAKNVAGLKVAGA